MTGRILLDILIHLGRHRARTILTASGLVAGILVLVLVGSLAETFNTIFSAQAKEGDDTLAVFTNRWDVRFTPATRQEVRRVPGVAGTLVTLWGEHMDPDAETTGFQLVTESLQAADCDIPGVEYGPPFITQPLLSGRRPLPGATNEILVDFDLADAHGWDVGQTVAMRGRPFVIVGILERPPLGGSRSAYLDYQTLRSLLHTPTDYGNFDVIPEPGQDLEALAALIEQSVPGTSVITPSDQAADRGQFLMFGAIAGLSGGLALLVGALTVANTMLMSVEERRAEIGLKKALGATDGDVVLEFVLEAGVLGALAGAAALLLGWLLLLGANIFLRAQWGLTLLTLTPRLALVALGLPAAVAAAAGTYPAWRAARQDPIHALRNVPPAYGDDAGRGLRSLVRAATRRARSLLTVGGISAGIFILTIALSVAEFLNSYVASAVDATYDRVGMYPHRPVAVRTATRELERMDGIRGVVRMVPGGLLFEEARASSGLFSTIPLVYGLDSPTGEFGFNTPTRVRVARGRFLEPDSLHEVVIGPALAESQGLDVGGVLDIHGRDFTVVGIWEDAGPDLLTGSGSHAYISIAALRALGIPAGEYIELTALLAPGVHPEEIAARIREQMPEWEVLTAAQAAGQIRQAMQIFTLVLAAYVSLGLLAGGLSIMNTMIFSVSRHTREIGLKKAVGAGDGDVLAEVVEESGWVGLLGGALGVAAGWLVTLAVNAFTFQTEEVRLMLVTPRLVAGALIFTMFLGMIAGIYPAARAARLDPVQALRSE